ncbi:TPA: hypothetical protein ACGXP5_004853 [Bacillus pacificus]
MLNRVIYGGQVYYKVNDLGELFELSPYRIKKTLTKQDIETTKLKGFGRTLFVLEGNISAIEVNGEITIIKTEYKESIQKKKVETADEVLTEETKNEKEEVKSETDKEVETSVNNNENTNAPNIDEIEKLQREHANLVTLGKHYGRKFLEGGKMDIATEICEKHLGKGVLVQDTTPDDIEKVRLLIPELKIKAAETELCM